MTQPIKPHTRLYRVQLRTYNGQIIWRTYTANDPAVARALALAEYAECEIITVTTQ